MNDQGGRYQVGTDGTIQALTREGRRLERTCHLNRPLLVSFRKQVLALMLVPYIPLPAIRLPPKNGRSPFACPASAELRRVTLSRRSNAAGYCRVSAGPEIRASLAICPKAFMLEIRRT